MALDHYIPRCLTRPWHDPRFGGFSLRVFDFETRAFTVRSSKKFFARRGVNTPATEKFLSKYIEDPFAVGQDAIRAAAPDIDKMKAAFSGIPASALVGLYWLQIQRIRDAYEPRTQFHLDEVARRGPTWLEAFSGVVFERYEPLVYLVNEALYFPETGTFMVPQVGQMPAMALPIDTALVLVFADRKADRAQLDSFMISPSKAMACSLGFSNRARRVVLPPELEDLPSVDSLLKVRAAVREIFKLYSEVAWAEGLPTWRLDPEDEPRHRPAVAPD